MARVVVATNTNEVILDLTTWKDDSVDIRAKVLPEVRQAIETAYEKDSIGEG